MSNDASPTSGVSSSDFEHVQLEEVKAKPSAAQQPAAQPSSPKDEAQPSSTAAPPLPSGSSPTTSTTQPASSAAQPLIPPAAEHQPVTLDLTVFGIDDLGLASTYRPEDPSAIDGLTKTAMKDLEDVGQKVAELARTAASDVSKLWQHSEPSANLATLSNGISNWFSSTVSAADTTRASPATLPAAAPSRSLASLQEFFKLPEEEHILESFKWDDTASVPPFKLPHKHVAKVSSPRPATRGRPRLLRLDVGDNYLCFGKFIGSQLDDALALMELKHQENDYNTVTRLAGKATTMAVLVDCSVLALLEVDPMSLKTPGACISMPSIMPGSRELLLPVLREAARLVHQMVQHHDPPPPTTLAVPRAPSPVPQQQRRLTGPPRNNVSVLPLRVGHRRARQRLVRHASFDRVGIDIPLPNLHASPKTRDVVQR